MKKEKMQKVLYQQQQAIAYVIDWLSTKNTSIDVNRRDETNSNKFEVLSKASDMAECKRTEVGRLALEIEKLRQELMEEKRIRKKLRRKMEKMEARWIKKFHKLEGQFDDEKAIMLMLFRKNGYAGKDSLSAVKKEIKKSLDKKSKMNEQLSIVPHINSTYI